MRASGSAQSGRIVVGGKLICAFRSRVGWDGTLERGGKEERSFLVYGESPSFWPVG